MTDEGRSRDVTSNPLRIRRGLLFLTLAVGACQGTIQGPLGEGPEPTPRNPGTRGSTSRPKPGDPGTVTPPVTTLPMTERCQGTPPPAATALKRLSNAQYRNTVRDLFTLSGVAAAFKDVEPALARMPEDTDENFSGLNNSVGPQHIEGYFGVATDAAAAITSKPELFAKVAGDCATKVADKCLDAFLDGFGRNVYRRPLTAEEKTTLKALNDGMGTPAEIMGSMIRALLVSPRFLNHFEVDGTPVDPKQPDVLSLTPYEIASRLSYTFWRSMPDEGLMKAAADNVFKTPEGFSKEVDRVFADPRTKETLAAFYGEWLKLDKIVPFPEPGKNKAFDELAKGEMVGKAHLDAIKGEIRELTEWVAFTKKGSFADLLMTNASVTKSAELAKLYGTQPWSGQGEPPKVENGSRNGLFLRAALLVRNDADTNPFHRGAMVRRRFLCDSLAAPDPTQLPDGALKPPPFDPNLTTRQRYDGKMGPLCVGCHTQFNDMGYILEAYDSLGRFRTKEKVFDESGKYVKDLDLDLRGVPRVKFDDTSAVNGPGELMQKIVESGKAESCFAGSFFTFALRREAAEKTLDACTVDSLGAELRKPKASLAEVYKRLALQASFVVRKVGAQ